MKVLIMLVLTSGTIFSAQPIARWAFPDQASVTGTVQVGLVAYSADGIDRIEFSTDGGTVTTWKGRKA